MKFKYILVTIVTVLSLFSCEKIFEDPIEEEVIPDENLVVNWVVVGGTGEVDMTDFNTCNAAYWDDEGIYFSETSVTSVDNFKVKDLTISETGNIAIVHSPYATVTADALYSTTVSPDFWTTGPNYADLVLGGAGYTPSAYYYNGGSSVTQGGYLKLTSVNDRYISGEVYFKAWVYNNQLNREVSVGIYCEFEGVEYQ